MPSSIWCREALARGEEWRAVDPMGGASHFIVGWTLHKAHRFRGSLEHLEKALALEPGYPWTWPFLAASHAFVGRTDEAARIARRVLDAAPFETAVAYAIATLGYTGHSAEAHRGIEVMGASLADRAPDPFNLALAHAGTGDVEAVLTQLERAVEQKSPQRFLVATEPFFDIVRSDPRFARILAALRLPRITF